MLLSVLSFSVEQNTPGSFIRRVLLIKPRSKFHPTQVIVVFREGVSTERIEEINRALRVQVIKEYDFGKSHGLLARIPNGTTVPEIVKKYQEFLEVKYAEPDYRLELN